MKKQTIKYYIQVSVFDEKRNEKNLTHKLIAKELGVSEKTVSNWVNSSHKNVHEDYVSQLCELLEVSEDKLFSLVFDRTGIKMFVGLALLCIIEMLFNARVHPYDGLNTDPKWTYPIAFLSALAILSGYTALYVGKKDKVAHKYSVGFVIVFACLAALLLVLSVTF